MCDPTTNWVNRGSSSDATLPFWQVRGSDRAATLGSGRPACNHAGMSRERLHFAMPRPVPPGRFRRVPPVMFLAVLAALELSLAWARGAGAFALPAGVAQLLGGMVTALAAFALFAYGCKLARRPSVLAEELAILPGRAGTGAGVLCLYLLAALVGAMMSRGAGLVLLILGLLCHAMLLVTLARVLSDGLAERRQVSPDWHLSLAGLAVGSRAALALDWPVPAAALALPAILAALAIWGLSLRQVLAMRVPAPLRVLLALHVGPVAMLAILALELGWIGAGTLLAWFALGGVLAMVLRARWLLAVGFSALWGAPAFALAASASAWAALWAAQPTEPHRIIAGLLLALAALVVLPVLVMVLREWMRNRLPARSNAAIA